MDHQVIDLTCCPSSGGRRSDVKRSHSKLVDRRRRSNSRSSRRASSSSSRQQSASSSSSRHTSEMPSTTSSYQARTAPRHNRFSGDGLDFRRPINSTSRPEPSNVVDLTGSDDEENNGNDEIQITSFNTNSDRSSSAVQGRQRATARPANRGPRYAQPIIHDEDNAQDPYNPYQHRREGPRSSLRTHGLSSRTLPPLPQQLPSSGNNTSFEFAQTARPEVIEIIDDVDEDDPIPMRATRNHQLGRSAMENHSIRNQAHVSHAMAVYRAMQAHIPIQSLVGPVLDYTRAAFNIGFPPVPVSRMGPRPPSPPAYDDLPPVADGFTRSPRDGDVLICPFCEAELCIGEGDPRSQVWVVKACGHVYCGGCASSRPKSSRVKKNPAGLQANERKLTACVVPNCTEKVTGAKAMYQLFL